MRFAILGPVEVSTDDGELLIKNGRERFVLALLLLSADRLTPSDRLIDALWDEPPPTARAQLHNIIRGLRRRLGEAAEAAELIGTRPLGYEFRLGDHELDLLEFRRVMARGRQAAVEGDAAQAADIIESALGLWRGPALADVDKQLASRPRSALDDERAAAAEDLLKARLELGQHDDVLRLVASLIEDHPHRERLYEMQMRALATTGRRADALEAYQQAYRRLGDDLGVEPGPALRDLEQQVLEGAEMAPAAATVVTPRQLPAMLTTLTGRDELVREVGEMLCRSDSSGPAMALLVGPGGIGKTTLATAIGHQLADRFTDGQLYADLRGSHADTADPHDVLAIFLRSLGVAGSALPDDAAERATLYRSMLADKRTFVLLDDAGDERQVRPLLPGGAGCGVIVTSRQRLGALVGGTRWTVPGLRPADAADLLARIVGPDRVAAEPEAAASVVAACGHLPLAVSIAAARLAVHEEWSLAELGERLNDERRRLDELRLGDLDVRASIALSYEALDQNARRLLRRLGLVSAPDWPSWVAYGVADHSGARAVDAALDDLADAHLVESLGRDPVGQTRFRLHDLVAEYAHERAEAEEDERDRTEVVTRVLSGWLALASEADQHVAHGQTNVIEGMTWPDLPANALLPSGDTANAWFETERTNLVQAIDQACRAERADLAGGLAIRLSGFLALRAYLEDQNRTLQAARVCTRDAGRDDLLDRVLRLLMNLVFDWASPDELTEIGSEWLAAARRLENPRSLAQASLAMADSMIKHGRLVIAEDWLAQAIAAAEASDHPPLHAFILLDIATVHMEAGRVADALEPMKQALDIQRRHDDHPRPTAIYLHNYGSVLLANARLSEAEAALQESMSHAREVDDQRWMAYNEWKLAELHMWRKQWSNAKQRLDRARRVYEASNMPDGLADIHCAAGEIALGQGRAAKATEHLGLALTAWRTLGGPLNVARMLARLEIAHHATGDGTAAGKCRSEWRSILDDLELDEACLLLPPFLTDHAPRVDTGGRAHSP